MHMSEPVSTNLHGDPLSIVHNLRVLAVAERLKNDRETSNQKCCRYPTEDYQNPAR